MASNRYKYKENCLEDCQQLISNSLYDDVEECIQDLQDTYGPKSCLESIADSIIKSLVFV